MPTVPPSCDAAMPEKPPEILGLGVSTIDELIVLEHHPRIIEKQKILSRSRQCGGLTGSALVAASRMGCRCAYLVALGVGELSTFLRTHLTREGITLFEDNDNPDTEPYLAMILSEQETGERAVLWDNSRSRAPVIGEAEIHLALSARCLFVDHVYATAILDLVHIARSAGIDVVGDFERVTPDSVELMAMTNHIILPLPFARQLYGDGKTPAELATLLASMPERSLACITDGANGAWYALGSDSARVLHQPVFPMEQIVDTTGCGDVFHGVYMAALIQQLPPSERIRHAAAAAALKTQYRGAQLGAPTLSVLHDFLSERSNKKSNNSN